MSVLARLLILRFVWRFEFLRCVVCVLAVRVCVCVCCVVCCCVLCCVFLLCVCVLQCCWKFVSLCYTLSISSFAICGPISCTAENNNAT